MADNLTRRQRSYCMSRVKGKDTGLEKLVRSKLFRLGLRFRKHQRTLPGNPDIVFPSQRIAVFINGNFWHGYRFPAWAFTLTPKWRDKIAATRRRDRANVRRLRQRNWVVVRIWQHEVERDLEACVRRIERLHR